MVVVGRRAPCAAASALWLIVDGGLCNGVSPEFNGKLMLDILFFVTSDESDSKDAKKADKCLPVVAFTQRSIVSKSGR